MYSQNVKKCVILLLIYVEWSCVAPISFCLQHVRNLMTDLQTAALKYPLTDSSLAVSPSCVG